ncbi:MAG: hypothetical protein ACLGGU_04615 [Gammaproteobacteria bacterium]
MALNIQTFSNVQGGNALFKAFGHPLTAERAHAFIARLENAGALAIYDPLNHFSTFAELYDVSAWDVRAAYVQRIEELGRSVRGLPARLITGGINAECVRLLVAAFDSARLVQQIRHLVPDKVQIVSFDELRLPDAMLTNARRYLDPLNFATNLALLRDADGQHTRLVTCNYWHGHGAGNTALWLCLFDGHGKVLAQWQEALPASGASIIVDSREVRKRFGLKDFTGTLFVHAQHVAGHDIVKYALDTYGDNATQLSCTHDANAWPSDLYAGLPAPQPDETVLLWIQNSHPRPIPAGAVGLNMMGSPDIRHLDTEIPPFGTYALDVARLLPDARWPEQLEVRAGKYFVRPRYEVVKRSGRRRIAHVNVERDDLKPDPQLPKLGAILGKGYLLPAPVLPPAEWRSIVQPTPMATCQSELPLAAKIYDASGEEIATHRFGNLARRDSIAWDIGEFLEAQRKTLSSGYGHVELIYDFSAGTLADGWLHGLFRYEQRVSGHAAETSFGAHMFNMAAVYKGEPQSYTGAPPGLSTRLFLRLGPAPLDTMCHLIYPASTAWHAHSSTQFILHDGNGAEIAQREARIPCSGSFLWRYSEMFDEAARRRAGEGAYVIVRDLTCRLFGYHGLVNGNHAFSLDHMFGF